MIQSSHIIFTMREMVCRKSNDLFRLPVLRQRCNTGRHQRSRKRPMPKPVLMPTHNQPERPRSDTAAVCAAAQPWAQDGLPNCSFFLTDTPVRMKTVWFDRRCQKHRLDCAICRKQTRLTRMDWRFEAATSADWATSITFGEGSQFNTSLDNDTAINALKRTIRGGINTGDPTIGFINALTNGYIILNPPTAQTNNRSLAVCNQSGNIGQKQQQPAPVIGIILVVGGVAFAMFYLWPHSIRPALDARRRRQTLQERISANCSNASPICCSPANALLRRERRIRYRPVPAF